MRVIADLTRLGTPRLDGWPEPRSPITDDAQAHRLCRPQAGLCARLEGRAAWRFGLPLLPTEPLAEALPIQQGAATPWRVTPLAPPPRPPRSLAAAPGAGCAGTGGPGGARRARHA